MRDEAISESTFLRGLTRELHSRNAAVFAGAGLSMASGYVDWKGLLKDLITDLGLDPNTEDDLVTLAQYHCNQAGGNKAGLTQLIFDEFSRTRTPTRNHAILARLPIYTYWTTNYDKLIELALVEAKKVPDVKYTLRQLAVTRLDRDVVVYKMHGDVDHAAEAVICKDDYEAYPLKMSAFVSALRGDLIEKTFLFLGFSFSDPNVDYILSRVRVQYEQHARHHYCIQKKVSKHPGESDASFKHRELKQHYFIRDLKRFGIQTVLVNDYPDITRLLETLAGQFKRSSILISGAADTYGTWPEPEKFLHTLSYQLAANKNRIITGFGSGVGSAVVNGALAHLSEEGKTISDEVLVMRPFPQVATGAKPLVEQWTEYRKAMIDYAGIAVFVFGNKRDTAGKTVLSNGMRQEFGLSVQAGLHPLPIGATGFMAQELWKEVSANFARFYPTADATFRQNFDKLGDSTTPPDQILVALQRLIEHLQKP
jgi:hypothetical protein